MKFSTKAEYGLKAMVNLAKAYPQQKNIREISFEEHVSGKYLERLMATLRKHDLVTSAKGKSGGYVLTNSPAKVTVREVIEALEGPIAPMKCVGSHCAIEYKCPSSIVWNKLGQQISKTLNEITLKNLIK
jgi:Rrf2 family protein